MIIGLTGGIGVGKSFVASCFKELGAAVFDADFIVHQLYETDKGIIDYAEKNFPGSVVGGKIDRTVLSKYFLAYDENWIKFQSLVHSVVLHELELFLANRPLSKLVCGEKSLGEAQASTTECSDVFEEHRPASTTKLPSEVEFRKRSNEKKINRKLLVLDVPLLLETKFHLHCDFIIFVHTDSAVQDQRLNERNLDKEKFNLISNVQLPIEEKKKLSDFIIDAGVSKECVFSQVKAIVDSLT